MVGGRGRRDGDEEVSLTARRHVTQNPPGGLADHLSGRVHTLDSQANIGDPPGKAIVEVSLDPRPSMRARGFLHVEAKQPGATRVSAAATIGPKSPTMSNPSTSPRILLTIIVSAEAAPRRSTWGPGARLRGRRTSPRSAAPRSRPS